MERRQGRGGEGFKGKFNLLLVPYFRQRRGGGFEWTMFCEKKVSIRRKEKKKNSRKKKLARDIGVNKAQAQEEEQHPGKA